MQTDAWRGVDALYNCFVQLQVLFKAQLCHTASFCHAVLLILCCFHTVQAPKPNRTPFNFYAHDARARAKLLYPDASAVSARAVEGTVPLATAMYGCVSINEGMLAFAYGSFIGRIVKRDC